MKIIKKINKELSLFFPENAKTYDQNANQMIKKINQLKVELKNELSGIKDKPYVVYLYRFGVKPSDYHKIKFTSVTDLKNNIQEKLQSFPRFN